MHHKYALEHFRATRKEDTIYASPVIQGAAASPEEESFQYLYMGEKSVIDCPGVVQQGLIEDVAMSYDFSQETVASHCDTRLFLVLRLQPCQAKVVKGANYRMRSDHIAVMPYTIVDRQLDPEDPSITGTRAGEHMINFSTVFVGF